MAHFALLELKHMGQFKNLNWVPVYFYFALRSPATIPFDIDRTVYTPTYIVGYISPTPFDIGRTGSNALVTKPVNELARKLE